MGINGKFSAVALGVLIVSLAGPALAGGMKGEKNFSEVKIAHVDSGLGRTNSGGTAACPTAIVCMVNGVIINGPGQAACNGGRAVVVQQCHSKGR
jgi:hypothetical protein